MAIADLLERRTLIHAINDEELDVPKQFLISNFGGAPIATEEQSVDIYRSTGDRSLATFSAAYASATVVDLQESEFIATVKFPHIAEKFPITPEDLLKAKSAMDIYRSTPKSRAEKEAEIVQKYLKKLRARVDRREEWMLAQAIKTGIIQYAGNGVSFKIDMGIDSTYLPTLSGTSRWGQSAADIPGNLLTWASEINAATGGYGGRVILGQNAATELLSDPVVRADLGLINYDAGRLVLNHTQGPGSEAKGKYAGFTFETYAETYKDDNGTVTSYFPSNGVLLVGSTFEVKRLFGANLVLDEAFGDPYYSDSWEEKDPDIRWIRGMSRPLPLPVQEGSWVFATVMA